jgi:hypothetical protein
MAVSDWSTNPASNTTIDGVNIAEGCPPGNLNDMGRRIMASVRVMYDDLPDTSAFATKAGAVFEGTQPKYTGRGAYLHHNNASNASGRIFIQASGSPVPSGMVNGDMLLEY